MFIILIFSPDLYSQARLRPSIGGDYPKSVFVVTNRVIDTIENGGLVFTNGFDTASPLKYARVSFEGDEWFAQSCDGLGDMLEDPAPYTDWAVWVHGDGQSFLLSMKRALEIQHLHGVNLIVFSWPTKAPDKGPVGNFKNSMRHAQLSVPYLGEICLELQEYRRRAGNRMEGANLSIFFHSLANYLLQEALAERAFDDVNNPLFNNIILNAPAVNSSGHNEWVSKLDMQERIYVCFNDEDINLEGLRVLSSMDTQLGERPELPLADNAIYLDFTGAVAPHTRARTGATHSYYYDYMTKISTNIWEIYTDLLHGKSVNFGDPERFEQTGGQNFVRIKNNIDDRP